MHIFKIRFTACSVNIEGSFGKNYYYTCSNKVVAAVVFYCRKTLIVHECSHITATTWGIFKSSLEELYSRCNGWIITSNCRILFTHRMEESKEATQQPLPFSWGLRTIKFKKLNFYTLWQLKAMLCVPPH